MHPLQKQRTFLSFAEQRTRTLFSTPLGIAVLTSGNWLLSFNWSERKRPWLMQECCNHEKSLVIPLQQISKCNRDTKKSIPLKGRVDLLESHFPKLQSSHKKTSQWCRKSTKSFDQADLWLCEMCYHTCSPLHWCWALMSLWGGCDTPYTADTVWFISR